MKIQKQYRLAIFDVDGTLLDTSEGLIAAFREALSRAGLQIPEESVLKRAIGPPFNQFVEDYYQLSREEAHNITNLFRDIYSQREYLLRARPYDGIYLLCKALHDRSVGMAVATNKRYDYTQLLLKEHGFEEYFWPICGTDFFFSRSKTDLINECVETRRVTPEITVMIGDSKSDASAAEKAGVDFIGLTYGFGFCRPQEILNFENAVGFANNTDEILNYVIGGQS